MKIKNDNMKYAQGSVTNGIPCIALGIQNGTVAVENSRFGKFIIKSVHIYDLVIPGLVIYTREMKTCLYKTIYSRS